MKKIFKILAILMSVSILSVLFTACTKYSENIENTTKTLQEETKIEGDKAIAEVEERRKIRNRA